MNLEHWIDFRPAHDCISVRPCHFGKETCAPGSSHNHGRHGVDMTWYVRGPLGVIQFKLFTGWMLDATPKRAWIEPMAADLGYHSPTPHYEDQYHQADCSLLAGGCYYDGSGLMADEPWRLLRHKGGDAVWAFLDARYAATFSSAVSA